MQLAEVLTYPIGTIIRRDSWPLHWWFEIDMREDPFKEKPPKIGLKYFALISGKGPMGTEAQRGQTMWQMGAGMLEDVIATDWSALGEPPIRVAISTEGVVAHDWTSAIVADGTLLPVESIPERASGYRRVTVLVPVLDKGSL
jgi:hypothetical protein